MSRSRGIAEYLDNGNRLRVPPAKGAHLGGGTGLTYKEREMETIRRLRQDLGARQSKTQPEWMVELNSKGELIQMDEVAQLICEVQA